jgi:hypothetical protein
MALKKTIELTLYGEKIFLQNAYIKVDRVSGNKTQVELKYVVYSKKDGEIVEEKFAYFSPNMDGENFVKQAYEHLKTLPEFAGATDC